MTITITKRLEIDAGHRLLKHEGKCAHVHGHRYAFEVECAAHDLDEVGRVIDFSVIKAEVGGWLDGNLDHGFIAQQGDSVIGWLEANGQKLFVMSVPPTAENLADLVLHVARALLAHHGVVVVAVTCYETPSSAARAC